MAITLRIEMEFSGRGNGWTTVTDAMGVDGIQVKYGIGGSTITDRVAATGELKFSLNNSPYNSAQKQGYYSPNHPNVRAGFSLGIRVRFSVIVPAAGTFYKFVGGIGSIDPIPGIAREQRTRCVAVDIIDDCARYILTGLPVQVNRRSDQIFQTIVGALPRQPSAIEIDVGLDTYPYALDNTSDTQTYALSELQKLAMSELGFIYTKGDVTQGGTLVFESRSRRPKTGSPVDTFTDVQRMQGLQALRARDYGINKVAVTTHPRTVDASPVVLYVLQVATRIDPNSPITILAEFTDPNNRANKVGGTNVVITTVSGVNYLPAGDFKMNAAADGSGADLTPFCTVTIAISGNAVRLTVVNTGGQAGYVGGTSANCLLRVRGQGIYDYQQATLEASDITSINLYGQNAVGIDMPYQSDPAVGNDASLYLVHLYKDPLTQIQQLKLRISGQDDVNQARIMRREISDRIAVQETVTGLAAANYFINQIQYEFNQVGNLDVTWLLAPADATKYWILEQAGASELDNTTVLGYGLIIGHGDIAHVDLHSDSAHQDVAHVDVAHADVAHGDAGHSDSAHSDVAHSDSHTDVAHADVAHSDAGHGDIAHSDSHNDVAHVDTHSDIAHNDVAHTDNSSHSDIHDDTAHGDVAHGDVLFTDSHTDVFTEDGTHVDHHGDIPHQDVSHGDAAHLDDHTDTTGHSDIAHQDVIHTDTHSDGAHADDHQDTAHTDAAHADVSHSDVSHSDVAHSDSHTDVAHGDTSHTDSAHSDVTHTDVTHVDVTHGDAHTDIAHTDA